MAEKNLSQAEVKQRIQMTMQAIQKDFGDNSVMILGDTKPLPIERISSGSYYLDEVMGGGYPKGRFIEIYGPESSGKTTIALHAIAEVQKLKQQNQAVFIDVENALDINYAKKLGVNVKELILSQPETAEEALSIAEAWIRSGVVGIIVIDSVAGLVPKQELEGDIGDNHVGLLARLMSQTLRRLSGLAYKTGTIVIFINQLREKVGVMFGNPETTPGGRALKFYSSIRLDVRPKEITKKDGFAIARTTHIKAVKNKVAPPFREADIDIEFGVGISKNAEIIDMGSELGVIHKSGAWYSYKDNRIGQGKENAKQFLSDNPELTKEIDETIRSLLQPQYEPLVDNITDNE